MLAQIKHIRLMVIVIRHKLIDSKNIDNCKDILYIHLITNYFRFDAVCYVIKYLIECIYDFIIS